MGVWRRLGLGVGMAWLGALLGLVLGTAALELLFPGVPLGVRFVVWSTVVPAPALFTIWFYRGGRADDGARITDSEQGDESGLPGAG